MTGLGRVREGGFQDEDRAGAKLCGRERGERRASVWLEWREERAGRGGVAGRVWNNKTATDCGPDRPHRGGALIQGAMRAADMT